MYLKNHDFNHGSQDFYLSVGADRQTRINVRERILFHHFASGLQVRETYNDPTTAPRELTTVSADLQRILQDITEQKEYELTLLLFSHFHNLAKEAFGRWMVNQEKENLDPESRMKLEFMSLLEKMVINKVKKDDNEDEDDLHLSVNNLIRRIDLVKKSRYSFNRYMELLGFRDDSTKEVDSLLKSLFSSEE